VVGTRRDAEQFPVGKNQPKKKKKKWKKKVVTKTTSTWPATNRGLVASRQKM